MDSVKRRPGRPSNASLAAAAAATGTTPVKPPPSKSTPKPKAAVKKPVPETPVEVLEGGRSKRTPKPNPRYMNDTVYSSSKSAIRDDSTASEEEFGELGSSDDFDAPVDTPIKKRPLDKGTPKTAPPKQYAKKPMNAAKAMAHQLNRRTLGGALIGADKRKWSGSEFDIDDEHGKELFLAAKRRLTHSPAVSGDSDSDAALKAKPLGNSAALAAKLRAKYNDLPLKKNNATSQMVRKSYLPADKKTPATAKQDSEDDLEDFEKMPTFTIVNINDIMNQKDDNAVVIKKRKLPTEESSEEEVALKKSSDTEGDSPKPVGMSNRRKTQHKILSEDRKAIPGNKISPLAKRTSLINNKVAAHPGRTYEAVQRGLSARLKDGNTSNKPAILRPPPPRILNATLCKPSKQSVPSLVTKLITKTDLQSQIANKQNNNTISMAARAKENNVTSYTYTEKDGQFQRKNVSPKGKSPISPITRTIVQRSSSQLAVASQLGNKRVKKITCFETWHVIKTPETKPQPERSVLALSMLKLGNDIKQVSLPSSEWSHKIILQKIAAKRTPVKGSLPADGEDKGDKAKATSAGTATTSDAEPEVYTGEINDPNINENDRHDYQPVNVMFRRKCQNEKIKSIQFDRTVVFKNQTFFVNIDGKHVKLLAAPKTISNLSEIETLLEIVNDISVDSPCVELTSHNLS